MAAEPIAAAPPRRRLGARPGPWLGLALLVALAVIAITVAALMRSETGSAWLLARVPGLAVTAPQGRLFGGPFALERATLRLPTQTLTVERLAWRDLRWQWRPHEGAWIGLALDDLRIARLDVGASPSSEPLAAPASLRLPLALVVDRLRIDDLQWQGGTIARDLAARIELGHASGAQHRLEALALRTERATIGGQARIAADPPFALEAQLQAASAEGLAPRWRTEIRATGPLAAIALDARLNSADAGGAQLDAQATLAPFAAWPLAALQARLRDLDLAALHGDAPRTRLSGQAKFDLRGLDQPIAASMTLTNAEPGRWDQRRLPVAGLELDLSGHPQHRDELTIRRFELMLPADGGRASGQGRWQRDRANIELRLPALRPAAVDSRAPAMRLAGTLRVQAEGLPAPDGSRPAASAQQARATLQLEGRLDTPRAEPVSLQGELAASRNGAAWQLAAKPFEARAGASRWRGELLAERAADGAQRLASQGEAQDFDPAAWWASAPAARLNGRWNLELQAPAKALALPRTPEALLALRGQGQLELADSIVAGVPLAARAALDGRHNGWRVQADARAAGNRVQLEGQLAQRAAEDRWRLDLEAPALAALRPLAGALRLPAPWNALEGNVLGQLRAEGRWPLMRTEGELRASGLRAGAALAAAKIDARWQAGPDRDAPLRVNLDAQQLAQGALRLDSLRARIDGTLAAHRLEFDADTALRPPAWTDAILGAAGSVQRGSRVTARGEGRWQGAAAASAWAGTWRGALAELDARGRDAREPWLAAREIALQLTLDSDGRLRDALALPGRGQVLGAPLVWREARWQAPERSGAPPRLVLDAELQPLVIAPWLARWQPDAGFGGDLAVKGVARVRSGDAFFADIALERASGDLTLTQDGEVQAFGLTDLRLALAADGGTWHFTQGVAGANLGVLAGAQSLRVAPHVNWPAPEAPMQGVLEWQVADLGVWAPFTPPGWRVGGRLRTGAVIGGRFGAPEIEGRLEGSALAVRNLLQGVDLRDGELRASLRGADARIERFDFKGGEGLLKLEGGATLGEQPRANLRLAAERFRLLGRSDRRIVASGQATMALDARSLALDGQFTIDEGLIDISRADAPSLDADVTVRGGRHGVRPAPAASAPEPAGADAPRGPARANPRDVRVALAIDLGSQLKLRGRGLDTRLAGKLALSAPGGRLAIHGQVSAQDGTYAAYGQKLEIERGLLRFAGEAENPRLDILAVRPNLDVKVGVQVSGTAQSPRVRLASEPEMSEYDKLSWLVLGRASDGLARADTALLQRAALALLAGEGQTPDAALLANLGLDEFSVRQNDSGEVRDTVVTLGKQLSRRWYVGYERGVNSTTGTWQLIYRAAQRFTLRAQSGEDSSLDAIWTWRWN